MVTFTEFPKNPKDKTVFQSRQGLVFVFEKASNAWVRVTTSSAFALATPVADGLMTAADLRKMNRLYVPLPRTTLTSDQCQSRFAAGNIDLFSLDDFVRISGQADLHNAGRLTAPLPHKYRISLHTSAFDFGINKDALIKYLIDNNQLVLAGSPGPKGRKGPRGAAGNRYATGPKGPQGAAGQTPPCQFNITQDNLSYQATTGKAIIDIATRQVSATSYAVVLKQGVIGNPNLNPDQLQVNCGDNSTWVLAATADSGTITPLFYVDLYPIVETIKAKYASELQRLKAGHERIVQFWLSKLMSLFDAEKSALCCALFNCLKAVAKIPQPQGIYPQPLAVTGINTGPSVTLPGAIVTRGFESQTARAALPPDHPLALAPALPGTLAAADAATPAGSVITVTTANVGSADRAAVSQLPPGRYRVTIDDCCLRLDQHYSGDVRLTYSSLATSGEISQRHMQFPRIGYFTQPRQAANAYGGLALDIQHSGGPLGAYYPADQLPATMDGQVRLKIIKQQEAVADRTCVLTQANLQLFEQLWVNLASGGAGCGLVTRLAGQDYILVTPPAAVRSIDCLSKFGNATIAWPTLDGFSFLPVGPGPYTFKLDKNLTELVVANLTDGRYDQVRGCAPVAQVDGNMWVSKSIKQVILESFVTVLFPIG